MDLSVQEHLGNHAWVDEVLCRAFVAGLRDEYRAGVIPPLFARRTNALVGVPARQEPRVRKVLESLAYTSRSA